MLSHVIADETGIIAAGYKTAADELIAFLVEDDRDDSLIFPIIFCYRQYVELTLKHIIELMARFDETGARFPHDHSLTRLWRDVKDRQRLERDDVEANDWQIVERLLLEFDAVDSRSFAFRYPEPVPFYQVDLGNLHDVMQGLAGFLDGLADMWDEAVSNKL